MWHEKIEDQIELLAHNECSAQEGKTVHVGSGAQIREVLSAKSTYHHPGSDCTSLGYENHSFAPVRSSCSAEWFVDGQDLFAAVAAAIRGARHEVQAPRALQTAYSLLHRF